MNEVFEKILERLRETKDKNTKVALDDAQKERCFWYKQAMDKAISIVQEVAEEYKGGWIRCDIEMPKERDSMFAKLKGTSKWSNAMFEKASDVVNVTVVDDKGKRVTTHAYTIDGKWCCGLLKMNKTYRIVAWRPYPEPFQ